MLVTSTDTSTSRAIGSKRIARPEPSVTSSAPANATARPTRMRAPSDSPRRNAARAAVTPGASETMTAAEPAGTRVIA